MTEHFVIIGAGQAAAQAIASLRSEGFAGELTLVGDEPFIPYQRPPLSKTYLMGTLERDRLFLKPDQFYSESKCELILGVAATGIDRERKTVDLSDGRSLAYDRLLLTTGSRVRPIACPGADLPGVFYLRGIEDVDLLRAGFGKGKRLAIVGGGYIGLEVAAVARKSGLEVTVFEFLDRLMARAVSPPVSDFYAKGMVSAAANSHYGADHAVQVEYAPRGVPTGLCAAIATPAPYQGEGLTLQPCTTPGTTVFIIDIPDSSAPGYFPIVLASTTDFVHPFTMAFPGKSDPAHRLFPQIKVQHLIGNPGNVPDDQLWGAVTSTTS